MPVVDEVAPLRTDEYNGDGECGGVMEHSTARRTTTHTPEMRCAAGEALCLSDESAQQRGGQASWGKSGEKSGEEERGPEGEGDVECPRIAAEQCAAHTEPLSQP